MKCISLKTGQEIEIPTQTVLCLGNFDGVHLGHQELLKATLQLQREKYPKAMAGVFTFDIPSTDFVQKEKSGHLCDRSEQIQLFLQAGMQILITVEFPTVKDLSPKAFVKEILRGEANCVEAVCGYNFSFGKDRRGSANDLVELFYGKGKILDEYQMEGKQVSSTAIRNALLTGKTEEANQLLGRAYSLETNINHGNAIGNRIGFPTANQSFPVSKIIPKHGVYLSRVTVKDKCYFGISNIGSRPTVSNSNQVNCETHLLGFSGNLYGEKIKVEFLQYLRSEKKFSSLEELKVQIQKDKSNAEKIIEKM